MMRKFMAMVSAAVLVATAFAPTAEAHDWDHGGGRSSGNHGYYGHNYRYDHRGNTAAVGVLGLVLGLAVGAALSQPHRGCYDRCASPPPCGNCGPGPGYNQGYYDGPPPQGYEDGSAYEQDYGQAPYKNQCTRQQRQWDRYANRYVTVDVPC